MQTELIVPVIASPPRSRLRMSRPAVSHVWPRAIPPRPGRL